MNAFADFLNALGGLHDSTVISIDWQVEVKTLAFTFDDLYANFQGLPEYPGRRTGVIFLRGLSQVKINIESIERLRVFEILPADGQPDMIIAKFSPGGHLTAKYASAEYPMNELLCSG